MTTGGAVPRLRVAFAALLALVLLAVSVAWPRPTQADSAWALDFDGTNEHVTFGAAPGLGLTTFTLEVWFKRQGAGIGTGTGGGGVSSAIPLITKGRSNGGDGTNADMNYFFGIDAASGVLVADFEEAVAGSGSSGLNHPIYGTTAIAADDTWHHAAVTYDGTWRLYLDGQPNGVLAVNEPPRADSIQHSALGTAITSTGVAAGAFNGVLDEARIWNVARTQAQINATPGQEVGTAPSLVGRWGIEEGANTTIADSSGSGITGTAVNGPAWVSPGFPLNSAPNVPTMLAPDDNATGVATSASLEVNVSDVDGGPLTVRYYGRPVVTPGEDFTYVAIPDTQHYVDSAVNHPTFGIQTDWIVDQQDDLNIVFASHLGDITEHIDAQEIEWERADLYMRTLDEAGVKNNVAPGNHDLNSSGVGMFFDEYFPPSRYEDFDWYGGYLGSDPLDPIDRLNKNNYELFSAGGMDFIVIHLEYDMPGYAVDWADRILDQYPDRRAIIATHAFLNTSNQRGTSVLNRPDGTTAEQVWQQLIRPHCNVFLIVNGHYPGEGKLTDFNDCGKPVHHGLTDYQSRINGGDGWLRYYVFHPATNTINAFTYSPKLLEFESDDLSEFEWSYDMSPAFELIATETGVASGATVGASWNGLDPDTEYEWYATVSDGFRTTTGATRSFTTGAGASTPTPTGTSTATHTATATGTATASPSHTPTPTPTATPTPTNTATRTPTNTSTPTATATPVLPDSDGDGYSDVRELQIGENPNSYCNIMRADVNGDTEINSGDLLMASFGFTTFAPRSDQNGDGEINSGDLLLISFQFGKGVDECA